MLFQSRTLARRWQTPPFLSNEQKIAFIVPFKGLVVQLLRKAATWWLTTSTSNFWSRLNFVLSIYEPNLLQTSIVERIVWSFEGDGIKSLVLDWKGHLWKMLNMKLRINRVGVAQSLWSLFVEWFHKSLNHCDNPCGKTVSKAGCQEHSTLKAGCSHNPSEWLSNHSHSAHPEFGDWASWRVVCSNNVQTGINPHLTFVQSQSEVLTCSERTRLTFQSSGISFSFATI